MVAACEVVVVWVGALRWVAGEYSGSGHGGGRRDRGVGRDRWGGIGSVGREREKVRCSGSGTGVVVGGGGRGGDKGGGLTISAQPAQAPADDLLRVRARKVVL